MSKITKILNVKNNPLQNKIVKLSELANLTIGFSGAYNGAYNIK